MPTAVGARVYKNASITIDAVEYENQINRAELVPETPIQTYRALVPDAIYQDVDSPSWTFAVDCLQINRSGGLAHALRALTPGEEVEVVLAPEDGVGDDEATFTIKAMVPSFGGTQGAYLTNTLVFPVVGQPVFEPQAS
jgi:hypothetical protein